MIYTEDKFSELPTNNSQSSMIEPKLKGENEHKKQSFKSIS